MAKRNQFPGALGCLDGGHAGHRKQIALGGLTALDHRQSGGFHPDGATGMGFPACGWSITDLHHVDFALTVEVT